MTSCFSSSISGSPNIYCQNRYINKVFVKSKLMEILNDKPGKDRTKTYE